MIRHAGTIFQGHAGCEEAMNAYNVLIVDHGTFLFVSLCNLFIRLCAASSATCRTDSDIFSVVLSGK